MPGAKIDEFYEDEGVQKKYESRVNELVKETKKRMKKAYSHVYHFDVLKKIARYEIAIYDLDKMIQNGKTLDEQAMKDKVAYERELRQLWSNMQMDMKGQRGDTKNVNYSTRDFKEFMEESLMDMLEEDD